jgi:hypothetical protein
VIAPGAVPPLLTVPNAVSAQAEPMAYCEIVASPALLT